MGVSHRLFIAIEGHCCCQGCYLDSALLYVLDDNFNAAGMTYGGAIYCRILFFVK